MQSIADFINQAVPFIAVLQSTPQFEKHMIRSTVISIVAAIIIGVVAGGFGTYVTVQLVSKDIEWIKQGLNEVKGRHNQHENNHLNGVYDDGGRGE